MITDKNGFIGIEVSDEVIAEAKRIRAERDKQYGNIFTEKETDMRWIGEIGEIIFNLWFVSQSTLTCQWLTNETAGKPDFLINNNVAVGVKTVKRKDPMQPGYTAQITAKHISEPIDYYFFCCYEFPQKRLWLLGGITKTDFMKNAQYYGAGEQVHPNYTVRSGHEIYNIEVRYLTLPAKWLSLFL